MWPDALYASNDACILCVVAATFARAAGDKNVFSIQQPSLVPFVSWSILAGLMLLLVAAGCGISHDDFGLHGFGPILSFLCLAPSELHRIRIGLCALFCAGAGLAGLVQIDDFAHFGPIISSGRTT